jgi:hypothetical protein
MVPRQAWHGDEQKQRSTCPIRAHFEDLEHFQAFGDFTESITYAGTTRRRLPTPPASTSLSVSFTLG